MIAEVKRAWAYYQYAANLCSMYRDQDKMAEELKRIGEIRYQQGEITLLEKNMMTTTAADLHNRWYQAQEEERRHWHVSSGAVMPTARLCRQIRPYLSFIPPFRTVICPKRIPDTSGVRRKKRKQCFM